MESIDPRSPPRNFKRSPFTYKYIKKNLFDPRSPSIKNRTPLKMTSSDTINLFDPRSPSQKIPRTPLTKDTNNNSNNNSSNNGLFDPRSPSIKDRTPLKLNNKKPIFDPRSPSLKIKRSPILKNNLKNVPSFDPRSPSLKIKRSPISSVNQIGLFDPRSPSLKKRTPFNSKKRISAPSTTNIEMETFTSINEKNNDDQIKQIIDELNETKDIDDEEINSIIKQDLNGEFMDSILSESFKNLDIVENKKEISKSTEIFKSSIITTTTTTTTLQNQPIIMGTPTRISKLSRNKDIFRSSPTLSSPKRVSLTGVPNRMSPVTSNKTSPSNSNRNSKVIINNQQENINLFNIFVNDNTLSNNPLKTSSGSPNTPIKQPLTPKISRRTQEPLSPIFHSKKVHYPRTPSQLIL